MENSEDKEDISRQYRMEVVKGSGTVEIGREEGRIG